MSSDAKYTNEAKYTNDFDSKPIPVGGSRVPVGMEAHANWKDLPEQATSVVNGADISAAYVEAETKRNQLGEIKKLLAAVSNPVAAIFKNQTILANTQDEEKRAKIQTLITQEEGKRDEIIKGLRDFQSKGFAANASEFGAALARILDTTPASSEMEQMNHVKWNDEVKKTSQQIFREQTKLMEVMKAEKKKKASS